MAARDEDTLLAGVKKGLEEVSQLVGEEAEEVWGELLFNLVALANLKGVDAESALRKAVRELEKGLSPAPSRTRTGWHDTGQGAGPTLPRSGVTTKEPSLLLSS